VKTYKHLYVQIHSFENLYHAYRKARRGGKRKHEPAAAFELELESNLIRLRDELREKTYHPSPYRHFYICERKRRLISAAPFRDRVVHHSLCSVIEPLFERRFIHDSYACRKGKGTHRAVDRAQEFARRYRYLLQCDVRQFFPSVDHAILRQLLARVIADPDVLWLCDRILESGAKVHRVESEMQWFAGDDLWAALRPRGLPIGNQTSQFWANVYLDPLDQFVKRELKCWAYLRYCDDFLMFHDDKEQLWEWRAAIIERLADSRLQLHQERATVSRTHDGFPFLGFRVFPYYRRLRKENSKAYARRLRALAAAYQEGHVSAEQVQASVQAWVAHVSYAHSWRLRSRILGEITF
jgi:RNA-directed DNA polymerase